MLAFAFLLQKTTLLKFCPSMLCKFESCHFGFRFELNHEAFSLRSGNFQNSWKNANAQVFIHRSLDAVAFDRAFFQVKTQKFSNCFLRLKEFSHYLNNNCLFTRAPSVQEVFQDVAILLHRVSSQHCGVLVELDHTVLWLAGRGFFHSQHVLLLLLV